MQEVNGSFSVSLQKWKLISENFCNYLFILQDGEGKEEEEDSASNTEGTWTPPSLAEVASELAASTSSDSAEAFTSLFRSPTATSTPDFPGQTLEMMSNFAHSVYMVSVYLCFFPLNSSNTVVLGKILLTDIFKRTLSS